jgi:hypothetical protein
MKITAEQIISWEPCEDYSEHLICELVGDGVTLQEILDTDIILNENKMWLLLREEVFPGKQLHEIDCRVLEYTLSKIDNPNKRYSEAIRVKRLWLDGKLTDEELKDKWNFILYPSARNMIVSAAAVHGWPDILKIIKDYIGELQNEG